MASAPTPSPAASSGMSNNVAGLLCYLAGFITGIIFLVIDPYKNQKFVRFHAFQSIFFSIFCVIVSWVLSALIGTLAVLSLVQLAIFVGWLFLMYKAYNNETFKLPVIGDLAAKQAGL